ncbi:hypothetical protein GCK32_018947 [Trichostrongylus colubriformis]|uniref:Uncharacterized protein n=1 Tax=Trichostrongylus colubriformis TaxID=6319 RepID=A0AAN8IUV3_TRICO
MIGCNDLLHLHAVYQVRSFTVAVLPLFHSKLLDKNGTPELSKLRNKMREWKRDWDNVRNEGPLYSKFDVLFLMKLYLQTLWYRRDPRATVLKEMLNLWSELDSDLQQELRSHFDAFDLFA